MKRLAAMTVTAIALFISACGHPFIPSSLSTHTLTPPTPGANSTRPITTGVDLYVTRNYSLSETRALGKRDIAWIAQTLGVQAIGIAWDLSVPGDSSNTVQNNGPVSPSVADIDALTQIAQDYHLQVDYRVLFRVNGRDGVSESLRPISQRLWFVSLLTAETPYLRLATKDRVAEFVVGTELSHLEGSSEWPRFFKGASSIYSGTLSYAAWGVNFFSARRQLPPVTDYGVTAYPAVDLPDGAPVSELTTAWVSFLRAAPASVLRNTAIDEIGIPAEAGAYTDPWAWNGQHGTQDDQVQARWFEAACNAAITEHIRAIFFWNVNLVDNPIRPFSSLVKFEGRYPSEAAIRGCGRQGG
jgi:hypothetical protein